MKITKDNYDKVKQALEVFLKNEIEKVIKIYGSDKKLSIAMGRFYNYIYIKLGRANNIIKLEKLLKEIKLFYEKSKKVLKKA